MSQHELTARNISLRFILRRVKQESPATYQHVLRVENITNDLCQAIRLPKDETIFISTAALLHDVGKIAVPKNILVKPGRLTDVEYKEMQKHSLYGYACVNSFSDLKKYRDIVLYHHEKWDGSGYPVGLKAELIPLGSRIIAIADAYEAMTADRVYRSALSVEQALTIMTDLSGQQFDPNLLQTFFELQYGAKRERSRYQ